MVPDSAEQLVRGRLLDPSERLRSHGGGYISAEDDIRAENKEMNERGVADRG